jgi:hypothetical protein
MQQYPNFSQGKIDTDASGDMQAKSGAPITLFLSKQAKGEPFSEQSVNLIHNLGPEIKLCSISDEKCCPEKPPHNQLPSNSPNENLKHTCVCG